MVHGYLVHSSWLLVHSTGYWFIVSGYWFTVPGYRLSVLCSLTVRKRDGRGPTLDHQPPGLRDHQGILPLAVEGVGHPVKGYEVGVSEHDAWARPWDTATGLISMAIRCKEYPWRESKDHHPCLSYIPITGERRRMSQLPTVISNELLLSTYYWTILFVALSRI